MRIATWNLERLPKRKEKVIQTILLSLDADILILTETNRRLVLPEYTVIHTMQLPHTFDGIHYEEGETRVSIFSRYKLIQQFQTYDAYTSVCVELQTENGPLLVYGTIIGVFGNRQPRFNNDMQGQLQDFNTLFPNRTICLGGDLNCTFSGRPWPGLKVRQTLTEAFAKHQLLNTTGHLEDTVDHLVISNHLLQVKPEIFTWNEDKKLSDHVGHMVA